MPHPLQTNPDAQLVDPKLVELILGNIAEGVFTVDREFRITFFNHAAARITGFTSTEALGKRCSEVFRTSICDVDCPLRQSLRTNRVVTDYEIEILTRKMARKPISVCTAPLIDHDGRFLGGVETFRDLSSIRELQRAISARNTFQDIISKNAKMRQIFDTLPNIAQSDATVLIQGRSGTGKELFAAAIHNLSPRAAGPLVRVNCGAMPENLLESELFGHVRGAFTDAKSDRIGRFQAANNGTILLDEIGDTSPALQVKLLRVLEDGEVQPLGSERSRKMDVRVVAATNRDLDQLVAEGSFREDLYYRLNVVLITLPDLRERREDIPLLIDHFIARFAPHMNRPIHGVSNDAMRALMRYTYPGNVRELENIIEHACIVARGPSIGLEDLPSFVHDGKRSPRAPASYDASSLPFVPSGGSEAERLRLLECLHRNYWNIPRAASELGIHRTTLWRKVKQHGIKRP